MLYFPSKSRSCSFSRILIAEYGASSSHKSISRLYASSFVGFGSLNTYTAANLTPRTSSPCAGLCCTVARFRCNSCLSDGLLGYPSKCLLSFLALSVRFSNQKESSISTSSLAIICIFSSAVIYILSLAVTWNTSFNGMPNFSRYARTVVCLCPPQVTLHRIKPLSSGAFGSSANPI